MCHCGSELEYDQCCGLYHSKQQKPPTAEALVRSRYSAFVVNDVDYLEQTLHPNERHDFDREGSAKWAEMSEWLGLEVIATEAGLQSDTVGVVEYIARFSTNDKPLAHHEIGQFVQEDGQWFYVEGQMVAQQSVRREGKKVGRNEPCPCGSGKKYKKCCG